MWTDCQSGISYGPNILICKPANRLQLLSARPAVTFTFLAAEHHCPLYRWSRYMKVEHGIVKRAP